MKTATKKHTQTSILAKPQQAAILYRNIGQNSA